MRTLKILSLVSVLAIAACAETPSNQVAGPGVTGIDPYKLAGSGNYVLNVATGSTSRFSSEPNCSEPVLGNLTAGCNIGDGGAGAN